MMSNRGRAGLVIALVVVCSAVAGAAIERITSQRMMRHRGGGPSSRPSPEQDAKRRTDMLDHMTKDLSLTPVQRAGLDSVMRRTDSLLHGIRTEMNPRLTKVFEDSRAEMLARLDSGQREKFKRDGPRGRRGGGREVGGGRGDGRP